MKGLRIISTGSARPAKAVTNDDLAKIVDTSDDWIYPRTGIHSRYLCGEGETTSTLAIQAAKEAMERSGLGPDDISALICATTSPDHVAPNVACQIQRALDMPETIPVLDVNAACTGFIYALETARGFLAMQSEEEAADRPRYALVVGAEHLSKMLDFTDRTTCVLFGDGAGAAVVELAEDVPYASMLGAKGGDEISCEGPGPVPAKIQMDGKAVFRFATGALTKCVDILLTKSGRTMDDIDQVICHQANERIVDFCIRKLKAPETKFFKNMDHYGNTGAASVALALDEAMCGNAVKPGDSLLLVGFGAGLTWAGVLITVK